MQSENSGQSHLEPFRHTDSTAKDVQQSKYSENYVADNKGAHPKTLRRESSKSANLRQARGYVIIQAVCRLVSTILALAIAGLVARSLAVFNATKNYKVLMSFALVMPAWPSDYGRSLMATYLLLAAAAITLVFGILMAVTWCLLAEKTQWKGRLGHALSIVLPSISFALFVAALVVFKLYDGPDGIRGWSCMHQNIEVDFDSNEIGLGRVCNALNVAWGLGIAVAILEFVTLVIILINGLSARGREKKKKHVKVTRTGYHELEPMVDQELA
ncbi:hypothetical protein PFICI_00111 [Pestalotiopsis fici W106-1]|uniref:MARVEL domain-containing protein n=1 Tax=Pestalotiopsis fici (strain W106-1 / CGMCC3.15140) TaxID=1229662 RepID=W3XJS6_PESFW|nr:uncharacterized protein PFICI_00111 [Pestalotiopsis fici W106-1]ETS86283.1 hypothetical protein PFICI_00111 [Pestalotiopsis fici W106-1]